MEERKRAKTSHFKSRKNILDLDDQLKGEGSFKPNIFQRDYPRNQANRLQAIMDLNPNYYSQKIRAYKLIVKGFTPSAQLNIFMINRVGYTLLQVNEKRIGILQYHRFDRQIRRFMHKSERSRSQNLSIQFVNNKLYIIDDLLKDFGYYLKLDLPTGKFLLTRRLRRPFLKVVSGIRLNHDDFLKSNSKVMKIGPNFFRNGVETSTFSLCNFMNGIIYERIRIDQNDEQIFLYEELKLKGLYTKLPLELERYCLLPDRWDTLNFASHLNPHQTEYLLIFSMNRLSIIVRVYNSTTRKMLRKKSIKVIELLGYQLLKWIRYDLKNQKIEESELRADRMSAMYSHHCERLLFDLKFSRYTWIVSVGNFFGRGDIKFVFRKIRKTKHESVFGEIKGENNSLFVLIKKSKKLSSSKRGYKYKEILVVNGVTLKTVHTLTGCVLNSSHLSSYHYKENSFTLLTNQTLLYSTRDNSALIKLNENLSPQILWIMDHKLTSKDSLTRKFSFFDDTVLWSTRYSIFCAQLQKVKSEKSVSLSNMEKLRTIELEEFFENLNFVQDRRISLQYSCCELKEKRLMVCSLRKRILKNGSQQACILILEINKKTFEVMRTEMYPAPQGFVLDLDFLVDLNPKSILVHQLSHQSNLWGSKRHSLFGEQKSSQSIQLIKWAIFSSLISPKEDKALFHKRQLKSSKNVACRDDHSKNENFSSRARDSLTRNLSRKLSENLLQNTVQILSMSIQTASFIYNCHLSNITRDGFSCLANTEGIDGAQTAFFIEIDLELGLKNWCKIEKQIIPDHLRFLGKGKVLLFSFMGGGESKEIRVIGLDLLNKELGSDILMVKDGVNFDICQKGDQKGCLVGFYSGGLWVVNLLG